MINHELLLSKLARLGIVGNLWTGFQVICRKEKSLLFLNNIFSDEYSINNGVPQGSLIGPILFVLFINDLASVFDKCAFHFYADDTVFIFL